MKNTTVYVHYYGKRHFYDKGIVLYSKPVEVKETEQQYRTINGESSLVDRQKIDKNRTEKLICDFGRYYYISKNNDLQEFKRLILKEISNKEENLRLKFERLKREKNGVIDRFKQEGVI